MRHPSSAPLLALALVAAPLAGCYSGRDTDCTGFSSTDGGASATTSRPSTRPAVSVTWGDTSVDLIVSGGPGAYWFGMAETSDCEDCWTGEDCVYGYDASGTTLAYCHDGTDTGTSLTCGGDAGALHAGTTVFSDASFEGHMTYDLESDPDFGGNDSCFVRGADPSYYDGLGCEQL